jgi:hypothetical protein
MVTCGRHACNGLPRHRPNCWPHHTGQTGQSHGDGTASSTQLCAGPSRQCAEGTQGTCAPCPYRTHIHMRCASSGQPGFSNSLSAPAAAHGQWHAAPCTHAPSLQSRWRTSHHIHWLLLCDRLSNIRCTCQAPGLAWLEGGLPSGCCQPCCAALCSARLHGTGRCTRRLRLKMAAHTVFRLHMTMNMALDTAVHVAAQAAHTPPSPQRAHVYWKCNTRVNGSGKLLPSDRRLRWCTSPNVMSPRCSRV